jgi:hypothetical protein
VVDELETAACDCELLAVGFLNDKGFVLRFSLAEVFLYAILGELKTGGGKITYASALRVRNFNDRGTAFLQLGGFITLSTPFQKKVSKPVERGRRRRIMGIGGAAVE